MHRGSKGFVLTLLFVVMLGLLLQTPAASETLKEKVKEFELKNGMKFLVVERHEAPVAFCAIVFNVGAANEWPNVTGISHLLEHMMFKGTKMMGTTGYKKEIKYIEKTDEIGERTIALRKGFDEWRYRFNRWTIGLADRVITVSANVHNFCTSHIGLPADKLALIYNGVELPEKPLMSRQEARTELKWTQYIDLLGMVEAKLGDHGNAYPCQLSQVLVI